jgi:hypothetical protein
MADSSTASSVSPNSTASSLVDRSLLQGSSGIHSIDSFLVDSAIEEKGKKECSNYKRKLEFGTSYTEYREPCKKAMSRKYSVLSCSKKNPIF